MTHFNSTAEIVRELFHQLGYSVTTPELQKCGPVGEAMIQGIKDRQLVANALASPSDIDRAAVAQVVAGLRGGVDAIQECRLSDLLHAAEALELVLRLESAQSGLLAHLSRRLAPVAGDVAMWQTVIDAGRDAGAKDESNALEDGLRKGVSRSAQGALLAALIRRAGQGITQDLAHEIAGQFVGVAKESVDKTRQRGKKKTSDKT